MLFLLKNWKAVLLALALLALSITGVALYQAGKTEANQKNTITTLTENLRVANAITLRNQKALEGDQKAATAEALKATELGSKVAELHAYSQALADANRECLSGADVDRLRNLWN